MQNFRDLILMLRVRILVYEILFLYVVKLLLIQPRFKFKQVVDVV